MQSPAVAAALAAAVTRENVLLWASITVRRSLTTKYADAYNPEDLEKLIAQKHAKINKMETAVLTKNMLLELDDEDFVKVGEIVAPKVEQVAANDA